MLRKTSLKMISVSCNLKIKSVLLIIISGKIIYFLNGLMEDWLKQLLEIDIR